jgi:hypothetical protein
MKETGRAESSAQMMEDKTMGLRKDCTVAVVALAAVAGLWR